VKEYYRIVAWRRGKPPVAIEGRIFRVPVSNLSSFLRSLRKRGWNIVKVKKVEGNGIVRTITGGEDYGL